MSKRVTREEKLAEVDKIIVTLKRDGGFPHEVEILKSIAHDLRAGGEGVADPVFNILERMLRKIEQSQGEQDKGLLLDLARQVIKYWPVMRRALIEQARAKSEAQ